MSLRNRYAEGQSFSHPFNSVNLAEPLSEEDKMLAVLFEDWDSLTESHMRLGCSIAGRYVRLGGDSDEMVGAAMFGIVRAVDKIKDGQLEHDNITGYIVHYIHQECSESLRKNTTIPTPRKKPPKHIFPLTATTSTSYDDFNIVDFEDVLEKIIENDEERLIIELRREGFMDKAIAEILGISRSQVTKSRLRLAKRYRSYNG